MVVSHFWCNFAADLQKGLQAPYVHVRNANVMQTFMKAELIIPIETLRGQLKKDGYYFRMYRGQQVVQKCPRKWTDTPARKAARERFVAKYAKKKTG